MHDDFDSDERGCDRCEWQPWEVHVWLATVVTAFILLVLIVAGATEPATNPANTQPASTRPTSTRPASTPLDPHSGAVVSPTPTR